MGSEMCIRDRAQLTFSEAGDTDFPSLAGGLVAGTIQIVSVEDQNDPGRFDSLTLLYGSSNQDHSVSFDQQDRNSTLVQTLKLKNSNSTFVDGASGELVQGNVRITCQPSVVTTGHCTLDISELPTGRAYFVARGIDRTGLSGDALFWDSVSDADASLDKAFGSYSLAIPPKRSGASASENAKAPTLILSLIHI